MSKKCEWKDGVFYPCEVSEKARFGGDTENINWAGMPIIFCPFCGASIKKPIEAKVGMFGKFYDGNIFEYGVLKSITEEGYRPEGGGFYLFFTPGLPENFNSDGTPKENDSHE